MYKKTIQQNTLLPKCAEDQQRKNAEPQSRCLKAAEETEAAIHTGPPKLDNRGLEKRCLIR